MTKYLISIVLIAVSAGVFYLFIDPLYEESKALKLKIATLDETFNNSKRIQEVRDQLTFIPVERIEEVLPAAFNQDRVAPAERDEPLATSTAS